jgi:hypothetical protein
MSDFEDYGDEGAFDGGFDGASDDEEGVYEAGEAGFEGEPVAGDAEDDEEEEDEAVEEDLGM